jgi:hypothetical protein
MKLINEIIQTEVKVLNGILSALNSRNDCLSDGEIKELQISKGKSIYLIETLQKSIEDYEPIVGDIPT